MNILEIKLKENINNDEEILNHTFICSIDGESVNLVFDPVEFVTTTDSLDKKPKSFEIFTCSCGHAGCAGIFEGISVYREDNKVIWVDGDSKLKHNIYEFEYNLYIKTAQEVLEKLFNVANYRQKFYTKEYFDEYHYDVVQFKNAQELQDQIDFRLNAGIYGDCHTMKNEDLIASIIKESFFEVYDHYTRSDISCKIFCECPEVCGIEFLTDENEYLSCIQVKYKDKKTITFDLRIKNFV